MTLNQVIGVHIFPLFVRDCYWWLFLDLSTYNHIFQQTWLAFLIICKIRKTIPLCKHLGKLLLAKAASCSDLMPLQCHISCRYMKKIMTYENRTERQECKYTDNRTIAGSRIRYKPVIRTLAFKSGYRWDQVHSKGAAMIHVVFK